jgi:stage III sporulation protein AG
MGYYGWENYMNWNKIKSLWKFRRTNQMEKKKLTLKEIGIEKLIILLLCGIFLIVVSVPDLFSAFQGSKSTPKKNTVQSSSEKVPASKDTNTEYVEELENRLKEVLEKVDGIGKTEVMITLKSSKESVILKNSPYSQESTSESDSAGGSRVSSSISKEDEAVLVETEESGSSPYVVKEIEPKVEGVVVIAEGGGNINTINEINSAIEVLFDVPVHKIKVMKMNDAKQ